MNTRMQKRSKVVYFRVTPEELKALDAECWRRGVTMSALLRDAVGMYFGDGHETEESALYWRRPGQTPQTPGTPAMAGRPGGGV
jgi:hypothetical protein